MLPIRPALSRRPSSPFSTTTRVLMMTPLPSSQRRHIRITQKAALRNSLITCKGITGLIPEQVAVIQVQPRTSEQALGSRFEGPAAEVVVPLFVLVGKTIHFLRRSTSIIGGGGGGEGGGDAVCRWCGPCVGADAGGAGAGLEGYLVHVPRFMGPVETQDFDVLEARVLGGICAIYGKHEVAEAGPVCVCMHG